MGKFGLEFEAPTDDDASSVQVSFIMPMSLGNLILSGRNRPAEEGSALPSNRGGQGDLNGSPKLGGGWLRVTLLIPNH